jgi:hypothetical protein
VGLVVCFPGVKRHEREVDHLHLVQRLRMAERYLYSITRLRGPMFNKLSPGINLPLLSNSYRMSHRSSYKFPVKVLGTLKSKEAG